MKKIILVTAAVWGIGSMSLFGAGATRPSVAETVAPTYPSTCVASGIQGGVVVEGMINERGELVGANVVGTANPELAKAALDAVSNWKFTPAVKDGIVVPMVVRLPVEFKLDAGRTSHMDPSLVARS